MIKTFAKIFFAIAVLWSLAFVFKLGSSFAMTNDQNELYLGCVENAMQLGEQRAKQYCRCITLMITDKYSIKEIERIGLMSQEIQLEKFSFATNYCNLNAKAPGD